jgi:hypothetical protein
MCSQSSEPEEGRRGVVPRTIHSDGNGSKHSTIVHQTQVSTMKTLAFLFFTFLVLASVEAGQIRGASPTTVRRIHRQIPHGGRDLADGTKKRAGTFNREASFLAKQSRQVDGDTEDEESAVPTETRFPKGDFTTDAPASKGGGDDEEQADKDEEDDAAAADDEAVVEDTDKEDTYTDDADEDGKDDTDEDDADKDDADEGDKVDDKNDDSDDETRAPTSAPTTPKLVKAVTRPDGKLPGGKSDKKKGPFAKSSSSSSKSSKKTKKEKKPKADDSKDSKKMNKYDVRGFKKGIRLRYRY